MPSSRCLLIVALAIAVVLAVFPAPLAAQTPDESRPSPTTLMGCVSKGVEAGCIILKTSDGKTYSLHGKDLPTLDKGLGVTAKGKTGGADHCMQSTVFQVSSWDWNKMSCPRDGMAR